MFAPLTQLLLRHFVVAFFLLQACILLSLAFLYQRFRSDLNEALLEGQANPHPMTAQDVLSSSSGLLSSVGRSVQSRKGKAFESVSKYHAKTLPTLPVRDVCWIFTCANRKLPYRQIFKAGGFRHIDLGMPPFVAQEGLHAVWCRVGYLREIMNIGQRCVIYADDDVYLNLSSLQLAIRRHPHGSILVTSAEEHGTRHHINAGFLVFTDF